MSVPRLTWDEFIGQPHPRGTFEEMHDAHLLAALDALARHRIYTAYVVLGAMTELAEADGYRRS
jgi:hypothetical protein